MKISQIMFILFLGLFFSCEYKKKQVEGIAYQNVNILFKNLGRLDRSMYDSIFFLKGCEKDTTYIKNYLSNILKASDTVFQKLDKGNLSIEYYKATSNNKLVLAGISNKDTIVSITDKSEFRIKGDDIPFLIKIKEGKVATFGMMQKSDQIYLIGFCQ